QVEIALRAIFERPTVAGLAEAVEEMRREGRRVESPPIVRIDRGEELPLSHAQQRLWFIQQLEPGSVAYNIPMGVRLRGALEISVTRQSLGEIVRRHEALRTRFESRGGRPAQVIEEPADVDIRLWDVSDMEGVERERLAGGIARREAGRP